MTKYEVRKIVLICILSMIAIALWGNCIQVSKEYKLQYVELDQVKTNKYMVKASDVKTKLNTNVDNYSTIKYNNDEYLTYNQIKDIVLNMKESGKPRIIYATQPSTMLIQYSQLNPAITSLFVLMIGCLAWVIKKLYY